MCHSATVENMIHPEKNENMALHVLAVSSLENSQNALSLFPASPLMPSPSTCAHLNVLKY